MVVDIFFESLTAGNSGFVSGLKHQNRICENVYATE
jgi:hypothetical protein